MPDQNRHDHGAEPACACGAEIDTFRGASFVIVPAGPDDPPPPPPRDCPICRKPAHHIGDSRPWRPVRGHDSWCDYDPDDTVTDHLRTALRRIAESGKPFLGIEMRKIARDALDADGSPDQPWRVGSMLVIDHGPVSGGVTAANSEPGPTL